MRVLNLDIEVSPAVVYTWDLKIPGGYLSPDKIIHPKKLLCFAGKWVGEDDVHFFSDWEDGHDAMVSQIWTLLDQADAVLHYNGKSFDIPHLNTEFALMELTPPSPYAQIDLWKVITKHFSFMSNSLDHVSKRLGTETKLANSGFTLWTRVMDGDEQAQREMESYNIGDVFANEDLYSRILPFIPSHPNYAVIDGGNICPQCGSDALEPRGYAYTALSRFQRHVCLGCGTWLRDNKRLAGADLRRVT